VLKPLPEPLPPPSTFPTANPSPTITSSSIVFHGDQSFDQDFIALGVICPIIFILIIGCCGWRISRKYRKRRRQRKTERSQGSDDKTEHGDGKTEHEVSEIGYKVEKHGHEVDETGHKVEEKRSDMSTSVKDDDSITAPPPNYAEALEDSKGEELKENCL
jgi:flagellar biosynthesis/type III secretory pathway M-ring protein FliF/YscJ